MTNLKKYTNENLIEYLMQAHLALVNQDALFIGKIQIVLHMKVNKKIQKVIVVSSYNNLLKQLLTKPLCWLDGYEIESVKIEQNIPNKDSKIYKILGGEK